MLKYLVKWLLILMVIVVTKGVSQEMPKSKLYDNKNRLIADTAFKITKKQLVKWTSIEDTLSKAVLYRLRYPSFCFESEISGQLIFSFTIDEKGQFNDFRIEKYLYFKNSVGVKLKP